MFRLKSKIVLILFALLFLVTSIVWAENYNEAPELKEEVEAGKLPPVEERLPEDPYVVEPREKIGKYGGTFNLITQYTSAPLGVAFVSDALNGFVEPNETATEVTPRFAKAFEASEDKKTFTVYLRKGVKWSDGVPFTTEDIMFWYEDIFLNEELTPAIPEPWKAGGEVVKVKALDDYSFQFEFKEPQPFFKKFPFSKSTQRTNILSPKHYLKQFHPAYTDEEELDRKVEEAGFDNWFELFENKNQHYCELSSVPDTPVLTPYVTKKFTSDRHVFERNPYYWKVDAEGNQLPYVGRAEVEVVSDPEVANGKIISGEVDFNGFLTSTKNYPMYKEYEEKAGYNIYLWDSGKVEANYVLNQTSKDPVLREIIRDVRFRRALSLAINRQEINKVLYFGKANPGQFTVHHNSQYYKPKYGEAYAEYDPDRARRLLDEMGLDEKDSDGYRLRPDGKKLSLTLAFSAAEDPIRTKNAELVSEYWNDIGVDVNPKQMKQELLGTKRDSNDLNLWQYFTNLLDITFPVFNPISIIGRASNRAWPEYRNKILKGEEVELPEKEKNLREWNQKVIVTADDEERRKYVDKILESQAENLWFIGTVNNAPRPIIVNNKLINVPKNGLWCWDAQWTMSRNPEQFFFED